MNPYRYDQMFAEERALLKAPCYSFVYFCPPADSLLRLNTQHDIFLRIVAVSSPDRQEQQDLLTA